MLRSRTPGALHRFGPVWSLAPNKVSWTFLYSPHRVLVFIHRTMSLAVPLALLKLTLIPSSPSLSTPREFQLPSRSDPLEFDPDVLNAAPTLFMCERP